MERFRDRASFELIYEGRVLSNSGTATSEQICNGAVLHLIPSSSTKTPLTSGSPSSASPPRNSPPKKDAYINTGISKVNYHQTVFERVANYWDVRGFREGNISVTEAKIGEAVLIQDCADTTIHVTANKVNRILLDRCTNVKVSQTSRRC